jgi:formylglycine-generating enzyme required for sulfatase activity
MSRGSIPIADGWPTRPAPPKRRGALALTLDFDGALGLALALALALGACARVTPPRPPPASLPAPLSRAADRAMRLVPPGRYVAGSGLEERERAYADAERSAGDARARRGRWFDREEPRHEAPLPAFLLDATHVTNGEYREFVVATGGEGPAIDRKTWQAQGYIQDYEREVIRFNWRGQSPPPGRADHPVVLVTHAEAAAYCAWRGAVVGAPRSLPSAAQLERAMKGDDGRAYPFGDTWDPTSLNQAETGPGDTEPVGRYPSGAGPFGHLDLAGLAFHWTSTPWPGDSGKMTLKGSAWDDHAGVGRGAQRHGRPATIRHAIVGFRCAGTPRTDAL